MLCTLCRTPLHATHKRIDRTEYKKATCNTYVCAPTEPRRRIARTYFAYFKRSTVYLTAQNAPQHTRKHALRHVKHAKYLLLPTFSWACQARKTFYYCQRLAGRNRVATASGCRFQNTNTAHTVHVHHLSKIDESRESGKGGLDLHTGHLLRSLYRNRTTNRYPTSQHKRLEFLQHREATMGDLHIGSPHISSLPSASRPGYYR